LSLFRYFKVGLRVCDIVVNKFTFAISSPDEFLLLHHFRKHSANYMHSASLLNLIFLASVH